MEEVLDLYEQPYDPKIPMIRFDERPYQMLGEVREPLPMMPGKVRRFDPEYEREGNAYVHVAFEPLRGRREVEVSERRRGVEFAHLMHHLAEEVYPDAEKIRLVCDNLSTRSPAAFYETFSPEIAHRLTRKIKFIYTPVHGSWPNMAEIEISVLVRQCLERRLPDKATLRREAKAWQEERNRKGASVDWRFRTEDARIKLRSLYPSVKE
jgi:DDE superfamily endonuclease